MKDVYKGVALLLLAAVASIITLSIEDHGWQITAVKFESDPDVESLQSQILAGFDPTETQQPTAAGNRVVPQCFQGLIERDNNSDLFNGEKYVSVKKMEDMYIEVRSEYLLRDAFQTQSASIVKQVPSEVLERLGSASEGLDCATVNIYLAEISK